jgi:hypothetical protein
VAYGNTSTSNLHRMVSLGTGDITATKRAALGLLRTAFCEVSNTMARLVFADEPLLGCRTKDEITETLYDWQKSNRPVLNVVYVEKARLAVAANVHESHKRYLARL